MAVSGFHSLPLHDAAGADPAWLDAQYNPMTGPDVTPTLFREWAERSAAARRSLTCRLGVPYGDARNAHPLETLDVFPAAGTGSSAVLVFVHGGYWRGSDKDVYSFLAEPFVKAGFTVVMPNYPLCPDVPLERIPLSLTKALAWVHAHIAEFGGDPARITVAGHSAGGHLAAMLLSCQWESVRPALPPTLVRNAMAISGLFELEPFRHAPFLAPILKLSSEDVNKLSPARFPKPAAGLELNAVVGSLEPGEFQRQNQLIQERWGRDIVPVCKPIAGRAHFSVLLDLVDEQAELHQLVVKLLSR